MDERKKIKIYGIIIGVILFGLLITGATLAYFSWSSEEDERTNVNLTVAKSLENLIVYNQGTSILETDGRSLSVADDYTGGISATIEFWKKANVTKTIYGMLSMEILNMLSASDTTDANIAKTDTLKWTVTTYNVNDSTEVLVNEGTFNGRSIDDKFSLTIDFELNPYQTFYKVYLWIDAYALDSTNSISGELISTEISASASDTESTYNGTPNVPDLIEGLIPVKYDTDSNNWVVASATNTNNDWYDYDEKKWANAVLLTETKRNSLTKTGDNYTPGQAIGDSEAEGVLAFYVWIPRYKYKVWNIDKIADSTQYSYDAYTKGIDIVFEKGVETTGTITCDYSYAAPSATAGEPNETCSDVTDGTGYYTHPAFKFGNDKLTGIWVGKFELSSEDQTAANYGGKTTATSPRILPDVMSWRYAPVSYFWKVISEMQNEDNIYGISTDKEEIDSHMLTNMEWGVVAYLAHSKYGRCTGGDASICTEVAINNSGETSYYTNYTGRSSGTGGSSGYTATGTYTYDGKDASTMEYEADRSLGMNASTTGNIYGIYDMSGGALEYVMGNIGTSAGQSSGEYAYNQVNAGTYYTYAGNEKYLTPYAYGTTTTDQTAYNRGRLGDATSESLLTASTSGGWYGDYAYFPFSSVAWFVRGGYFNYSTYAGVFIFLNDNGYADYYSGARASLVCLAC